MKKWIAAVVGIPIGLFVAAVALGLAISTPESYMLHDAEDAVENQLRDSSSATFRNVNVYKVSGKDIVCGEVNSKNGFGAMAGYSRFFYVGGRIAVIEQPEIGPNMGGLWSAEGCDGSKGPAVLSRD